MRENLVPSVITMHHCHHPEITVDGDTATGTWYLEDKVIVPEQRFVLEGAVFYSDATCGPARAGGSATPATAGPTRRPGPWTQSPATS
jgi:hypothetical protein